MFVTEKLYGLRRMNCHITPLKHGEIFAVRTHLLPFMWNPCLFSLGHRTRNRPGSFEKDESFYNSFGNSAPYILNAKDDEHRRLRRLQSHAFSEKALKAQESIVKGYVDLLMKQLSGRALPHDNCAVDLVKWYNFTTFDIIGDLAYGEPFGCLRDGIWHRWLEVVFEFVISGIYLRAARRFDSPLKEIFLFFTPKKLAESRKYQYQFSAERVDRRLQGGSTRPDFSEYEAGPAVNCC